MKISTSSIRKVGRSTLAPMNTNLALRELLTREQTELRVGTAKRLARFHEAVQESRNALTSEVQDIINMYPEYSGLVAAASTQLQAVDQQLVSDFTVVARRQQDNLRNVDVASIARCISAPSTAASAPVVLHGTAMRKFNRL